MRHGKFQKTKRKFPAVLCVILLLAVLGASFSGARAYLSHSADSPVTNSFTTEVHPTISVGPDYTVTVSNTNYAVYLRAAVVVNWKSTGNENLLAALPENGTDYTINKNWSYNDADGFYYYTKPVTNGQTTSPIVSFSASSKTGYTLVADVAVQAIQAVGTTDNGDIAAIQDAWGITALPTETQSSGS